MDPVTLIAGATAILSMASDASRRGRAEYAMGKKSIVLPSPKYAAALVFERLRRLIPDTHMSDLHLGMRSGFDGDGFNIAWEGVVLYDRAGYRGGRELLSHSLVLDRRDGKWGVNLGQGHYNASQEKHLKRKREHWFKVQGMSQSPVLMPSASTTAALLLGEMRKRDPNVNLYYIHMGPRPQYDGDSHDMAWEGAVFYAIPNEDGQLTNESGWLYRDFTMQARPGSWRIHLLQPENHIEESMGETLKPYTDMVRRKRWSLVRILGS